MFNHCYEMKCEKKQTRMRVYTFYCSENQRRLTRAIWTYVINTVEKNTTIHKIPGMDINYVLIHLHLLNCLKKLCD